MAAFEAAVELGYEYLETDVHATRDGRVVVFHDDTLERMTGAKGRIQDLTLAELGKLRVAETEKIPLLADLLDSFPDVRVNIDTKTDSSAEPLLQLLRRMDAWDRVCIGSFSAKRVNFLRREAGDRLCTSTEPGEIIRLWLSRFGLPPGRFRGRCLQVPPRRHFIRIIDTTFVRAAHDRGMPVHAWTIDDPAEMQALLAIGVDGIMTNQAALGMQLFKQHVWTPEQLRQT